MYVWGYYNRRNLSLEGVNFTMRSCRLKALICNKKNFTFDTGFKAGSPCNSRSTGVTCMCSLRLVLETSQAAEFGIISILLICTSGSL